MNTQRKRCDLCAFYDSEDTRCRRSPPAPVPNAVAQVYWPIVKRYDWCGAFELNLSLDGYNRPEGEPEIKR